MLTRITALLRSLWSQRFEGGEVGQNLMQYLALAALIAFAYLAAAGALGHQATAWAAH